MTFSASSVEVPVLFVARACLRKQVLRRRTQDTNQVLEVTHRQIVAPGLEPRDCHPVHAQLVSQLLMSQVTTLAQQLHNRAETTSFDCPLSPALVFRADVHHEPFEPNRRCL